MFLFSCLSLLSAGCCCSVVCSSATRGEPQPPSRSTQQLARRRLSNLTTCISSAGPTLVSIQTPSSGVQLQAAQALHRETSIARVIQSTPSHFCRLDVNIRSPPPAQHTLPARSLQQLLPNLFPAAVNTINSTPAPPNAHCLRYAASDSSRFRPFPALAYFSLLTTASQVLHRALITPQDVRTSAGRPIRRWLRPSGPSRPGLVLSRRPIRPVSR